ncbi:accessory colonization factor AcfD-like [Penaeus indicus]|uniref:accessory colonization factor AcfD-like n=1 Tax=Penaeus indicus TaxID=29960 RepID=UPI00300D72CD
MTDESGRSSSPRDGEAVYLVNQSSNTCLSVTAGSSPDDAVVAMAPFSGDLSQQWLRAGGQWLWGANHAFCLVPVDGTNDVGLGDANASSVSWSYDEASRIVVGSDALDVPLEEPRTRVILSPANDDATQKWTIDLVSPEEPEYFINQSSKTCLGVRKGSTPSDAYVGTLHGNGLKEQQWFFVGDSWQWGGNRSYCLGPDYDNRTVILEDTSTSTSVWYVDDAQRLRIGEYAIDVPTTAPRTRVGLFKASDTIHQKWWRFSELMASLEGVEPPVYPFPGSDETTYNQEIDRGLVNALSSKTEPLPYPRDVPTFPGTVDPETPRVNRKVTLDLSVLGQNRNFRMTIPKDWQATDLYVAEGDICQIILPESLTADQALQITVRVGGYTDVLNPHSSNIENKTYKRMPVVSEVFDVFPGVNEIRSQYGGNLIFMYTEGENFTVDVDVKNVVEAPYFRYGVTSVEEWEAIKTRDAPHAVLESDKCVLVVPSSDVQELTDPDQLMARYDEVLAMESYAAGFDETEAPPRGKYWLVNDIQIGAGSAHSGFPVMFAHGSYHIAKPDIPYDWVVWHELGHNHQQGSYWCRAYGSESSVNLFSLYIQEQLFDADRLEDMNGYVTAADKVDNGMTFDEGDVWDKLVFLMEIKHAFPEGWEMFRQLYKTTRALSDDEAHDIAGSHQLQIDHAYKNLSKSAGYDLVLTYDRWGLELSEEAKQEIQQLGLEKAPGDLSHRPPSGKK